MNKFPQAIAGLLVLGVMQQLAAQQRCYFSWKEPVSGSFLDAGRWDPGPAPPAGPPGCQGRAPLPGESFAFRQGTYSVTIPGAQSGVVVEFGTSGPPPWDPWDITFELAGSLDAANFATAGQLTVTGSGTLNVTDFYNLSPNANFILDQANATMQRILRSAPGPADLSRQFLVRNHGTLTTLRNVGVYGITVDGGTWHHAGDTNESAFPDTIRVLNGGHFDAAGVAFGSTRLSVESGSTVQINEIKTRNHITVSGASQMTTRSANFSFGDQSVDGTGSKWTINQLVLPDSGMAFATNRAELILDEVFFQDPNGIVVVSSRGTDSRVTVRRPLRLAPGNATAVDGGIFTVPEAHLGSRGNVNVQRGPAGLGGSQFNVNGILEIGDFGANAAAQFTVGGGGRAFAQSVTIGRSPGVNTLSINAGSGTARFDVGGEILVGDLGRGSLGVANGGRLELTSPAGGIIITPTESGDGDMTVDGLDSIVDLKGGFLHVGRAGTGRLNVTGGGKIIAGGFNVGDVFPPTNRLASILGDNSAVQSDFAYVGNGTIRVLSGGLFQVTSSLSGGNLTLQPPSLVDLSSGRFEIGNAGGSPVGVMRVDSGLLRGSGTIRCTSVEVIDRGVCQPGIELTAGNILRIENGSYLQDANATLNINIWGTNVNQFGVLDIARGASLDGKLVANFINGAAPRAGAQFGIVRFREGLVGAFSSLTVNGLEPGVKVEQKLLAPGVYGLEFMSDGNSDECEDDEPRIKSVDRSVPGQVTLSITAGTCGFPRVEYSEDLVTWRVLATFTVDFLGQAFVVDRTVSASRLRFYRVVRY